MFVNVQSIISVLGALTALLVSMTGLFLAVVKITSLRNHINSRMDQLLALQAVSSHAEGVKDESDRAHLALTISPFGTTIVP